MQRPLSWVLLLGFMLIVAIARGAYASLDAEPSARFQLLTTFGQLALLWFWFSAQIARYRPPLILDLGLLMFVCWIVVVPYYMWHYERWWGLAKFGVVCMAYVASLVVRVLVAMILS